VCKDENLYAVEKSRHSINSGTQYEAIDRALTSYVSRSIWAEHGRNVVNADMFGNILLNCPLKEGISREELVGLSAELECDDNRLTTITPVEHLRKYLPWIWAIRSFPYYAMMNAQFLASTVRASNIDPNLYGLGANQLQSPKNRLNRSSSGFEGKRIARKQVEVAVKRGTIQESTSNCAQLDVGETRLLRVAEFRRRALRQF